ncbi:RCC1 domain-containing protein, partial [Bifidobacterium asteroides]|uniref:RCC1 domain-containing protein n=1 Tax=Bifidobacterium asteroides TaxID=1684 RepID=UPI0020C2F0A1
FTWKQVRLGYWHTAAFGSDGQLYTWGYNGYGNLGDGTNTDRYRPVQVVKPQGAPDGFTWKQIILGGYHCAAFGSDGNLYTWGENEYGELGDGTTTNRNKPIQVGKPAGASDGFTWKQIFLGDWHSAAIGSDGNLYTWGYNSNGQLGDGTTTNRNKPTMVSKPQGAPAGFAWQQASLGWQHTEAIGSDGQLYAWGDNSSGQLGDGTTADRHAPGRVSMPGAATPTKVLFGQAKTTGITANPDGTWQATTPGHDPGTVDVTIVWNRNGPQPDAHLRYTFIAWHQVVFVSKSGSCPAPSGMPASQSVVQGGRAERPYPDPKAEGCLFDGWFQGDVAYDFTRPVTEDVTLTARWSPAGVRWAISPGQGPETGGTSVTLTPSPARGIRFSQTSTGRYHSAAIGSDGQLYTWGDNSQGQLGRATGATSPAGQPGRVTRPADAPEGFTWKQASLGGTYSAAIGSDGQLYTWGDNSQGQLGRSVTAASPADRPGKIDKPADAPEGFTWKQASLGRQRSAAIGSDGQLYTWGDEGTGGLGRDVTAASPADRPGKIDKPADAPEGFTWKQASLGYYHSAAIGSDGNLYTWSDNNDTQLGRGTSSSNPADRPGKIDKPADAPEGFTWKQVSLGDYHSAAIGSDGSLYTWGGNNYDQLGRSITDATPSNKPGLVPKPAGAPEGFAWQQIGLGRRHSAAIGSDGQLYTWGGANYGQLGRSVTAASPAGRPGLVPKPAGAPEGFAWQLASLGRRHSAATGSNGQLYTWGNNSYGQLGDGNTTKNRQAPNPVNPPSTAAPTQVKFGQALGETLAANPDGTWQVTTPAYTPGPVTVAIDWTQDGKQQETDTSNTYRYLSIASLPLTGGDGMLLLLATGLLAAGAATAAKSRRRQTRTAA